MAGADDPLAAVLYWIMNVGLIAFTLITLGGTVAMWLARPRTRHEWLTLALFAGLTLIFARGALRNLWGWRIGWEYYDLGSLLYLPAPLVAVLFLDSLWDEWIGPRLRCKREGTC